MSRASLAVSAVLALVSVCGAAVIAFQDDNACLNYDMGMRFMKAGSYSDALGKFADVVSTCQRLAPDALLQTANYYFLQRDFDNSTKKADEITHQFSGAPAAASAAVLRGRILLATKRAAADLDTAAATFDNAVLLARSVSPDVIPEALYYKGETLWLSGRLEAAFEQYRDVALAYPDSPWARTALLGAAQALTRLDRPLPAMQLLQRIRTTAPTAAEATTALDWNTILYRLALLDKTKPRYGFSGKAIGDLSHPLKKDVSAITFDPTSGGLLAAEKNGISQFDRSGKFLRYLSSIQVAALTIGLDGQAASVYQAQLARSGRPDLTLVTPQASGTPRAVEDPTAVAVTWRGDWLVGDGRTQALQEFGPTGQYLRSFLAAEVTRVAADLADRVGVILRERKSVLILSREGELVGQIDPSGADISFKEPVDLAFDPLGNLYVLDRDPSSVWIFSPGLKLLEVFRSVEKGPGAFRNPTAMAVGGDGSIFIYDAAANQILIFQ